MTQKQEPVPMRPYCGSHPRQCIDQNPLRGRMRIRNGTDDSSRLRKITKPLMEKKRRERINMALEALKRFVAEPILKEGAQKLEKADILDLTVKYVYSCARRKSRSGFYVGMCVSETPLAPQAPRELRDRESPAKTVGQISTLISSVAIVASLVISNSTAAATWPSQAPWLSFLAGYAACEANLHSLLVAAAGASRPQAGLSPREMSLLVALDGRKNAAATSFLAALAAPSTSQTTPPAAHLQSEGEPTHPPQPPRVWRPW
ncbi:unnamed protein product [Mesocestoides corti]|uniref:BHLH domain-containing protein n=1 Tax=Mesocestoides corti TaxID=53468 RepID=A0A158QSS0_MESCO|nr:unnamed protein product [Mesocestoides corti]